MPILSPSLAGTNLLRIFLVCDSLCKVQACPTVIRRLSVRPRVVREFDAFCLIVHGFVRKPTGFLSSGECRLPLFSPLSFNCNDRNTQMLFLCSSAILFYFYLFRIYNLLSFAGFSSKHSNELRFLSLCRARPQPSSVRPWALTRKI